MNTDQLRRVAKMFQTNERVREELFQGKPKRQAIALLKEISSKLTIESQKNEIAKITKSLEMDDA